MSLNTATSLLSQLSLQGTQNSVERHLPSPARPSEQDATSSSDVSLAAAADVDWQRGTSIHTLDEDILLLILSLLDSDDLVACKRVRVLCVYFLRLYLFEAESVLTFCLPDLPLAIASRCQ